MNFKTYTDEEFFECPLRGANNVVNAVCGEKDFSKIPPDVLKRAGERGSAVHKAIEDFLNSGMKTMPQLDIEYYSYWDQFTKWREERTNLLNIFGTEIRIISEKLGCKGIIDCIAEFKNIDRDTTDPVIALIDWKTSSNLDMFRTKCQLQLYYELLTVEYPEVAEKITELRVLNITKTGYRWFKFDIDRELGKSILYIYNHYLRREAERRN